MAAGATQEHTATTSTDDCNAQQEPTATLPHKIQQYSHWGTVEGVNGEVDLNVFNGSRDEWNNWLAELGESKRAWKSGK